MTDAASRFFPARKLIARDGGMAETNNEPLIFRERVSCQKSSGPQRLGALKRFLC